VSIGAPWRGPTQELRLLARLAGPVSLGQLAHLLLGTVDILMLGQIGETELAAVGIGHVWGFAGISVGLGVASGLDPFLARTWGARDEAGHGHALFVGLIWLLLLSMPIALMHLLAGPGLRSIGQPTEVVPDAAIYCQILAFSVLPTLWFQGLRHARQAAGDMMGPASILIGANVVNVALNGFLVLGWFGGPALGVPGAAIATLTVRWLMLACLVVYARRSVLLAWASRHRAHRDMLRKVGRVALPVGLQLGLEVWAFNAASVVAGWLGTDALAAHTIALNLAAMAFMIPLGLSAAVAARVGNLIGAGLPWRAQGWTAIGLGAGVMVVSAVTFSTWPHTLARLYTDDQGTALAAATVLPIAAVFAIFDGVQVTAFGVLRGAGDTRMPTLANVVGHWMLGLPTGVVLATWVGLGLTGVWIGITTGLASVAILLLIRLMTMPAGVSALDASDGRGSRCPPAPAAGADTT
jgi:multidrug resistance protein, MATE family